MSATNDYDRARLLLDDILANLAMCERELLPVITRLSQRAMTKDQETDLIDLLEIRRRLVKAKGQLAGFHPNALEK